MVLEVYPRLADRAQVAPPTIRHGHLAYPSQRIQRFAGLGWSKEIHYRKVRRSIPIAEESHVLQQGAYQISFLYLACFLKL